MSEPKVGFFIVGAMKSGTTTLRSMLARHRAICLSRRELHYFDGQNLANGADWYHQQFEIGPKHRRIGEKTPSYGYSESAAKQILEYNPKARIIWILRDPTSRAISHYHHVKKRIPTAIGFEDIFAETPDFRPRSRFDYVYRSRYEIHVGAYANIFGRDHVHVVIMEELLKDPQGVMDGVFSFLKVKSALVNYVPRSNPGIDEVKQRFPVSPEITAEIRARLAPTVVAMEAFLGALLHK